MSGFAAELRRKRSAALTPEAATITGTSAIYFYLQLYSTRSFVFTRNSYVQLYSPAGRRVYYTNYYYVVRSTVVCTVQVYILLILTSLGLRYLCTSAHRSQSDTGTGLRRQAGQRQCSRGCACCVKPRDRTVSAPHGAHAAQSARIR